MSLEEKRGQLIGVIWESLRNEGFKTSGWIKLHFLDHLRWECNPWVMVEN